MSQIADIKEVIYQTRKTVFDNIFKRTSWCLEMWSNTVSSV